MTRNDTTAAAMVPIQSGLTSIRPNGAVSGRATKAMKAASTKLSRVMTSRVPPRTQPAAAEARMTRMAITSKPVMRARTVVGSNSIAVLRDSFDRFGQSRDRGHLDPLVLDRQRRGQGLIEAQLLRLAQPRLGPADGADLAGQADFAEDDAALGQRSAGR